MNDTDFKCLLNREAERLQDAYYEDWKNGRTVFQQVFMNESNPKMNDTLDYKISVMQAAKEGKEIERKPRGGNWFLCPDPTWDWAFNDYRVRGQEPRRALVSTRGYDKFLNVFNPTTEQKVIEKIRSENPQCLVEFIEVTPEVRKALSL